MLGGLGVPHLFKASAVVFSYLVGSMNRAAQVRQAAQFFLDTLEALMPLPVGDLIHGCIVFATPVLLIQLMEVSDLRAQTHDFIFEDS